MLHPFSENKLYALVYSSVWTILIIVQTLLFVYKLELDIYWSIIYSVIFNVLYAFMGASIWFVGAYYNYNKQNSFEIITKQIATAIVFVFIIIYSSDWLSNKIINDIIFQTFLNETSLWRYIVAFFYYIILSIMFFLIMYHENMKLELQTKNQLEQHAIQSELKALKSQVNPHFLFNSLNSISYLTISDGFKAQEMLVKLSDYIRYSLRKEENQFTILSEEIENLHSYLEIERIRFEDKIVYSEKIEEGLDQLKIPHLILQPLMENAIKYGVYESESPVKIDLTISSEGDFIKLIIENDFDESSSIHKGEGIGLNNISERLKLLYSKVGLIKTTSKGNRFTATLLIPIEYSNELK